MKKILLIISTLVSFSAFGNIDFCPNSIEKLPIQQNGRAKPLYVHAKEIFQTIGKIENKNGMSKSQIYCMLSLNKEKTPIFFKVKSPKIKELLDLKQGNQISLTAAVVLFNKLKSTYQSFPDGGAKKELEKLMTSISKYQDIISGNNWMVGIKIDNNITWQPINKIYNNEISINEFLSKLKQSQNDFIEIHGDKYLTELLLSKSRIFLISLVVTLLSLIFIVSMKKKSIGICLAILTIVFETIGMGLRSYIAERAPITNMYESVLFSGYGALLLALIIFLYKKDIIFITAGLMFNTCCLLMITFANSMLPSSISPLVPVLRDNFWLSTHVTSIMLSYGALALSWLLANIIMVKNMFSKMHDKDIRHYVNLIYTCLKFGVVFLSIGIILGGLWADYSWGRFWGWDPKETWSLIVLCIYLIIIHGKYTSWIPPQRFIPLSAGAFMSVMMAWFGVNYILSSGLHSYGFSQGGAIFLLIFFFLQTSLILISIFRKRSLQTT